MVKLFLLEQRYTNNTQTKGKVMNVTHYLLQKSTIGRIRRQVK